MAKKRLSKAERKARYDALMSDPKRKARMDEFAELARNEYFKHVFDPDFPAEARERLQTCCAGLCARRAMQHAGGPEQGVESFVEKFKNLLPEGVMETTIIDDVLVYDDFNSEEYDPEGFAQGKCPCWLVHSGLVPPSPEVCKCGNHYEKAIWESLVGHAVQVDLVDSCHTTGSPRCRWVIHLKPPVWTTGERNTDLKQPAQQSASEAPNKKTGKKKTPRA